MNTIPPYHPLWIINFVYYVKLIMHMKCYNSLLMMIHELNNGNWPIRTWYCNKLRTSRSNIWIFHSKWLKCKFWSSLKRRQQKVWFSLIRHSPDMYVWLCEGLRDDGRTGIIQLWEKTQKNSWESKSIHCVMKPIRIQLECPYNSSNETKNTHVWVFTFLYPLHKPCTFLYFSTCARPLAQMCY